ncbi:MAG TPA: hypothetical protein VG204_15350 [Terriglobia bacterium]|nr:hypothetical protein [Terriglobia bacterium]
MSATLPGHHQTTFEAAHLVLGSAAQPFTEYFETCRRKRNVIDYDGTEVVTESQARELLAETEGYWELVERCIAQHHPKLKRAARNG